MRELAWESGSGVGVEVDRCSNSETPDTEETCATGGARHHVMGSRRLRWASCPQTVDPRATPMKP